jgi:hypothetical protein
MWDHAQRIARRYPIDQQESYVAAAVRLRMPFWDALSKPYLPIAAALPALTVNTPDGSQTVGNPLYNYTFHPDEGGNRLPSNHWVCRTSNLALLVCMLIFTPAKVLSWNSPPLGCFEPAKQCQ